jgi:hypothetical protein
MKAQPERARRGRPPKFGRRGQVIAVTLPKEVVDGLRKIHPDLAWAIVTLFEKTPKSRQVPARPQQPDAELAAVGGRRFLIVVNPDVFSALPGVSFVPLGRQRAFMALAPGLGMSDLELAVVDRLALPSLPARERQALERLRTQLRAWRTDRGLRSDTRAIIVIERITRPRRRPK